MASSAVCGGCGCGHLFCRVLLPCQESPMTRIRTWTVCRQPSPRPDGERRRDQDHHLLVRLGSRDEAGCLMLVTEEVPDEGGGVCAGVDNPPGPGADDRAAA